MADPLYRLAYEATIDDAVDVSLRLASRTQAFRRQLQTNIIVAGVLGGCAFFALWMSNASASLTNVVLAMVAGTIFGIVFAAIFRRFFEKEIRKQQRKIVAEQFAGQKGLPSELELRSDAIWVRQAGLEMSFLWSACTGVVNNPGDVEVNFTLGMCVIQNRHFPSPADRHAFLETARRLSAAAAPSTVSP